MHEICKEDVQGILSSFFPRGGGIEGYVFSGYVGLLLVRLGVWLVK